MIIEQMHSCYIIDDDRHAVEALTQYIDKIPGLNVMGGDTNPLHAIETINKGKRPDIVFLDVQMPELSGLAVADMLSNEIAIVFTTAFDKYAVDAFGKNVVDFLLKPISFEKFERTVAKVKKLLSDTDTAHNKKDLSTIFLGATTEGSFVNLATSEISYIEANGPELTIHTAGDKFKEIASFNDFLKDLPPSKFAQVNNQIVVNVEAIEALTEKGIMVCAQQFLFDPGFRIALEVKRSNAIRDKKTV